MFMVPIAELGIALADLVEDQADWSRKTFGSDDLHPDPAKRGDIPTGLPPRGPCGAICHLEREAREAWDAAMKLLAAQINPGEQDVPAAKEMFAEEMADCLLLVLDASRRGGVKVMQLIEAAQAKMKKNKARQWPAPHPDGVTPVEHVREVLEGDPD